MRGAAVASCIATAAGAQAIGADEHPIAWRIARAMAPRSASVDSAITLVVRAHIPDGWYLYALTEPAGGPAPTSFTGVGLAIIGTPRASDPELHPDRNFDLITRVYEDSARFELRGRILSSADARPGRAPALLVRYQTCNDRYCLPPRTDTLVPKLATTDSPGRDEGAVATRPDASPVRPSNAPARRTSAHAVSSAAIVAAGADPTAASLGAFLWLAVTMGLLSLLTPCVLPMLPITLTMFGRGNASSTRRAAVALAGTLGIVATFAGVGLAVTAAFGAGGITRLAASPWLNVLFALLFAGFALNLLGAYEIVLPQRLLVPLGGRRDGQPASLGPGGAFALGAAFAITSFTCTAPLAGTLLVLAAEGRYTWPLLGLTTYALAFAIPIALLATVPAATRHLPRAGRWTQTLRAALGIVELAAALKFLSNADLVAHWGLLTRPVVLGLWITAALGLAWVLSGLPPRTRWAPGGRWVKLQPILALPALALAARLAFGLAGRPVGELEAYLPPPANAAAEPRWIVDDFDGALLQATSAGRPLIVDFTGYTCTNCRWMEANMFPRPGVRALLERFVRARLYTDGDGARDAAQQRLEQERFGTVALPFYAVFDRQGRPVATFLGMTRDAREFERFLARGVDSISLPTEAIR